MDAGHFSEVGYPLALPTNQIGKPATNSETYLPNASYTRYGGRVGGFAEFRIPDGWQSVFGSKPITASLFYADFTGKFRGVRHDLGETVGQISVPITSIASFAVTFDRGRSENVAAPVNSLMIGIKFGGQN